MQKDIFYFPEGIFAWHFRVRKLKIKSKADMKLRKVFLFEGSEGLALQWVAEFTAGSFFSNDLFACRSGYTWSSKESSGTKSLNHFMHVKNPCEPLIRVCHVTNFDYWEEGLVSSTPMGAVLDIPDVINAGMLYSLTQAGKLLWFPFT
jgi:hypothetical protein